MLCLVCSTILLLVKRSAVSAEMEATSNQRVVFVRLFLLTDSYELDASRLRIENSLDSSLRMNSSLSSRLYSDCDYYRRSTHRYLAVGNRCDSLSLIDPRVRRFASLFPGRCP